MNTLHVFNCDNDLALANFTSGFTPPSNIRMMMDELSQLPLAWENASIAVSGGKAWTPSSMGSPDEVTNVSVWGWSPAVCHRLRQMGVRDSLLPSSAQLLGIRRLSSRERAVELLAQMRSEGICADFQSVFCIDEAQVEQALHRWPCTILKAPWSGSGKGLRYGQGGREETLRGWYQRVIQQQGGVVVEPLYGKLHDLAMEFWSDGEGNVTYQGLSLFETHSNGAYSGNLLLPESEKQAWLDQFVPKEQSLAVRRWLEHNLSSLVGTAYRGYLGVDMMLTAPPPTEGEKYCQKVGNEDQKVVLHPMVEVNLRMTMGMVSILLQRQQPEDFRGIFRLDYFAEPEAQQLDNQMRCQSSTAFRILASGPHYRAYIE